ncbi:MAG TPA: divalent-cation tolerance protein CutA [Candidatus Saccharimonadales bacterium]|nr:divalent-cation tolerance protein CutA [Candidatus Saccharimonadales bacterium]
MNASEYIQVVVSCSDDKEAEHIGKSLLDKRLIACAKSFPVKSNFIWQGKVQRDNETLLVMETKTSLFDKIQETVSKEHSYDLPVIYAVPITHINSGAGAWINESVD